MHQTTEIPGNNKSLDKTINMQKKASNTTYKTSHIPDELEGILELNGKNTKKTKPPIRFLDDPLIGTTGTNED